MIGRYSASLLYTAAKHSEQQLATGPLSSCACAVAQTKDPASRGAAPATPDLPAYELPSWSRFPQSTSHASTTLQQLWLNCPDSFSLLLTPHHPHFPAHRQTAQDSAAQRSDSHEMTQPLSEALTQLTVQIQQHVQMLACGSTSASASMLHDLIAFLQSCQGHIAGRHESSAPMSANKHGQQVIHQVPSDDSALSESAADKLMAAALHVTAALIACDKACQQAVTRRLTKDEVNAQVLPLNAFCCLSMYKTLHVAAVMMLLQLSGLQPCSL